MNWYYGIVSCAVVYTTLSVAFPARETLIPFMVETPEQMVEGAESPR